LFVKLACSPECYQTVQNMLADPEDSHIALCYVCGAQTKSKCKRCGVLHYCSKECQKSDWPRHKLNCVSLFYSSSANTTMEQLHASICAQLKALDSTLLLASRVVGGCEPARFLLQHKHPKIPEARKIIWTQLPGAIIVFGTEISDTSLF